MNDANINIDKDSIMSRFIADIFGDIIKKYSGALTRQINLNLNPKFLKLCVESQDFAER